MPNGETIEDGYRPERVAEQGDRFFVLSGCSGGGKSTLLAGLAKHGLRIFEEPGRQIVREQTYLGGDGLPWLDVERFALLTASRSIHFLIEAARSEEPAVFDRSFIDQVAALQRLGLPVPGDLTSAVERLRYCETVFMVPPWAEIFGQDGERKHAFDEAVGEYDSLMEAYRRFGYRPVVVPKLPMEERVAFVREGIRAHLSARPKVGD